MKVQSALAFLEAIRAERPFVAQPALAVFLEKILTREHLVGDHDELARLVDFVCKSFGVYAGVALAHIEQERVAAVEERRKLLEAAAHLDGTRELDRLLGQQAASKSLVDRVVASGNVFAKQAGVELIEYPVGAGAFAMAEHGIAAAMAEAHAEPGDGEAATFGQQPNFGGASLTRSGEAGPGVCTGAEVILCEHEHGVVRKLTPEQEKDAAFQMMLLRAHKPPEGE